MKLAPIERNGKKVGWAFRCPGCGGLHRFCTVDAHEEGWPVWTITGTTEMPTVRASVLNRWGIYADPNWKEPEGETMDPDMPWSGLCHLFITDGKIEFLSDCTHKLKGQKVDMVDIDFKP